MHEQMCTSCKTRLVSVRVSVLSGFENKGMMLWLFSLYSCGTDSLFHLVSHTHTCTSLLNPHRSIASRSIFSHVLTFSHIIEMVNNKIGQTSMAAFSPSRLFIVTHVQTYKCSNWPSNLHIYIFDLFYFVKSQCSALFVHFAVTSQHSAWTLVTVTAVSNAHVHLH